MRTFTTMTSASLVLALAACGAGTDSRDARDYADAGLNPDAAHDSGSNNPVDAGVSHVDAGSSNAKDAGAVSTGLGQCAPGKACGGLKNCIDYCYSDRCCLLDCSCGAQDTLGCLLICN